MLEIDAMKSTRLLEYLSLPDSIESTGYKNTPYKGQETPD
jgi:hypothetical protein